jgi:hypothetical protein
MRTLNLKQGCLLLLIVTFAFSCKQVKYQEFGSFGGGKFSSNKSAATDNKTATSVDLGSKQTVEIEDYDFPTNASNTKIAGVAKLKNPTSNPKIEHEKSRISIKQVFKSIHKIKSAPKKQLLKEIKNQKQIFNYEGENDLMTIGFNVMMYSLILGFGFIILGGMLGIDSNVLGTIGLGGGVFGAIIGGGIWLLGAFISLLQ